METAACQRYGDSVIGLMRLIRDLQASSVLTAQQRQAGHTGEYFTLGRHAGLLAELIHCRNVDNFLAYITDLLALIYHHRPEMLKSSEKVEVKFIMQFLSMDDLINALAEKRVQELSYKSFQDLHDYLSSKIGLPLVTTDEGL